MSPVGRFGAETHGGGQATCERAATAMADGGAAQACCSVLLKQDEDVSEMEGEERNTPTGGIGKALTGEGISSVGSAAAARGGKTFDSTRRGRERAKREPEEEERGSAKLVARRLGRRWRVEVGRRHGAAVLRFWTRREVGARGGSAALNGATTEGQGIGAGARCSLRTGGGQPRRGPAVERWALASERARVKTRQSGARAGDSRGERGRGLGEPAVVNGDVERARGLGQRGAGDVVARALWRARRSASKGGAGGLGWPAWAGKGRGKWATARRIRPRG